MTSAKYQPGERVVWETRSPPCERTGVVVTRWQLAGEWVYGLRADGWTTRQTATVAEDRIRRVPAPPELLDHDTADEAELEARRDLLHRQLEEVAAAHTVFVTCGCGRRVSVPFAYRCRQCGVFFCGVCGLRHFGLAVDRATGRVVRA